MNFYSLIYFLFLSGTLIVEIINMLKSILIAGIGGFIGTVLRFLLSKYVQIHIMSSFPWATFIINIVGCFAIGLIYGLSEKGNFLSSDLRLFLTVGICGGFTTYSSFSNEMFILLQNRELIRFLLYSGLSFTLGLFFVFLGRLITKI